MDCLANEDYPCELACENISGFDVYCSVGFALEGSSGPAFGVGTDYDTGTTSPPGSAIVDIPLTAGAAACCPFVVITNETGTENPTVGTNAYQAAACAVATTLGTCIDI